MCRGAYIKNQHANCKRGLDNLHQEVNADRVEAEAALRVLAEMHQHRLQACIMQIASVGSVHAAGLNMANNRDVQEVLYLQIHTNRLVMQAGSC